MRKYMKNSAKYRLNSASKTFRIAFGLKFHQNTSKIPSKYHPNSRKYFKHSIKMPQNFHTNPGSFRQKMSDVSLEYFWKTCGKFGQNRRQYYDGIPVEFHQNSTVIPAVYLWNASGIPLEYCFKIPAFF